MYACEEDYAGVIFVRKMSEIAYEFDEWMQETMIPEAYYPNST